MLKRKSLKKVVPICLLFSNFVAASAGRAADEVEKAPSGPPSVTVECGDTSIRIDGPKIWTMSRIIYKGVMLGIEDSAYGSVYRFPGGADIGSAHTYKDEKEIVKELHFFLDGKLIASPPDFMRGKQFKLRKKSEIRATSLDTTVEVKDNHILETIVTTTHQDTQVNSCYHAMHAWTPSATAFIAAKDGGAELGAELRDDKEVDRKFYIEQPIDWFAIYDGQSRKGAVLRLLEKPAFGVNAFKLWNVPGIYRKLYFYAIENLLIPAGFTGKYRMITTFFEAEPDSWKDVARRIQKDLKKFQ